MGRCVQVESEGPEWQVVRGRRERARWTDVATRGRQQTSDGQQPGTASCPAWTSRPAWTPCPVWPSADTSGLAGPNDPDAEGRLTNSKSGVCKTPTRRQAQYGRITNCNTGACETPTRHQPQYDSALHELPLRQPLPPPQPALQNLLERCTGAAPPSRTAPGLQLPLLPPPVNAPLLLRIRPLTQRSPPPLPLTSHTVAAPHSHTLPPPSWPPPSTPQHAGPLLINGRPAHLLPPDHPQHTASLSFHSVFRPLPVSPLHSSNAFAALADSQQPTYTLVSRPPPPSATRTCSLTSTHASVQSCGYTLEQPHTAALVQSCAGAAVRPCGDAVTQQRDRAVTQSCVFAPPAQAPPCGPTQAPPYDPAQAPPCGPTQARPCGPIQAPPYDPAQAPPCGPTRARPCGLTQAPPYDPAQAPPCGPTQARPCGPIQAPPYEAPPLTTLPRLRLAALPGPGLAVLLRPRLTTLPRLRLAALPRPRFAALPRAHSPSSTTTSAATEAA